MKALWTGSIGFGIVYIPCRLYSATRERGISFHQIHRDCNSRIQMPLWCPVCQRKVERSEIKKGYEIAKGEHVLLEESDFETLPLKTLKTIDIVHFCRPNQIDPRSYKEKHYYVVPEEIGLKAFSLLCQAMVKTKLIAIAKLTFRRKEELSAIRPFDDLFLLQTLYYSDEIVDYKKPRPSRMMTFSEEELSLATKLIRSLKTKYLDLSKYHDEYEEALRKLIEAKMAGKVISVPETKPTKEGDLVEILKASIKAVEKR